MPTDVKRKNNLAISNWQPPTEPIDNWQPPSGPLEGPVQQETAPDEGPSAFSKAYEFANRPLLDITSPAMRQMTTQLGEPGLNDSVMGARVKGFTTGAMQGLADLISSQSSPLGLGLEGLTAGASQAMMADAPMLASALHRPGQIAAGGMVAHGLYNAATDPDWIHKLGALSEAAMGGAGAAHLMKGPRLRPTGVMTPPESSIPLGKANLPPEFTAVGEEPAYKQPETPGVTEASRFNMARERQVEKSKELVKAAEEKPKPKLKITDYWIKDENGNRILNPKYQTPGLNTPTDITAGFGGHGHPENPEYVKNVLGSVREGPPGLSVHDAGGGQEHVVYRDSFKKPIAVAKVVTDASGKKMVMDMAADKTRGLGLGRAMMAVGNKLGEMGATEPAGTISTDAQQFLDKMKSRQPASFKEGSTAPSSEPYFIKQGGKFVANPAHPALKEQLPEQARAKGGKGLKIGSNIEGAAKELTTGYSAPIHQIMVREGLQNALDAVKHLGDKGEVRIRISDNHDLTTPNKITISDNGKGMSRQELQTVFSDLNSSGKAKDPNATGGKGVGKATYILGGDYFELKTVKEMRGQKIEFRYKGTPGEIFNGVDIKYKVVDPDTPTGTTFKTTLSKEQDPSNARIMAREILAHSRDLQAKVTLDTGTGPNTQDFRQFAKDKVLGTENFAGNEIKVAIPFNSDLKERQFTKIKVLNNGMFQYSKFHNLGKEVPGVPENIIVNIKPTAEEGTTEYPFPTQRESLKTAVDKKVTDLIDQWLVKPQANARKTKLIELYGAMKEIDHGVNTARETMMYDPGDRLTPVEQDTFEKSPVIKDLSALVDKTIDEILKSVGDKNWQKRLERTGIILDPESHGIHIPNPDTGHSAIMINPFLNIDNFPSSPQTAAFEGIVTLMHETAHIGLEKSTVPIPFDVNDLNHPKLGQYLDSYFKEQREHGNINQGHSIGFLTRMADVYAAYGPEKFFDAVETYHDILTDPNTGHYNEEVQNLLSIYQESRGRDATTEDFLSRTGERAKATGGGEGNIRGNDKANAERASREPSADVIDRLTEQIKIAGAKREEQEQGYSVERAKRIAAAQKVNTGGLGGFYKQLHELKGELPKPDFNRIKIAPADVNDLLNKVDDSPYLLPYEKISAKMGLLKMISSKREAVPERSELGYLREVFGSKIDPIIEMHGGLGGGKVSWEAVKGVAGLQKALMASIDMSGLLRQGGGLIHKKEWRQNIIPMVKMFGSKEFFDASQQAIKDRQNYLLGKEAGLKLTDIGTDPTKREEAYTSGLAEHIPGVAASERAYVGFLNKLRADTFDSLIAEAKAAGIHPKDLMHEIADFVNVATGRGKLPGRMDRIATDLNAVFFSPRLMAARVQMLNPKTYIDASPFVRKEFIKSAVATASVGLMTTALMSMMGAKTATKLSDRKGTPLIPVPGMTGFPGMPVDADFGKSRFGNTRVENYQGYLSYITYLGRMLSGERESSTTGKMYVLGKGFNAPTRATISEDFMANKLSPAASLVWKMLKQKDPMGKEYQFSPTVKQSLIDLSNGNLNTALKNAKSGEIADTFIPMFLGDLISVMKDDPNHLPAVIPSFFGAGVQTYGKTPRKSTGGLSIRP